MAKLSTKTYETYDHTAGDLARNEDGTRTYLFVQNMEASGGGNLRYYELEPGESAPADLTKPQAIIAPRAVYEPADPPANAIYLAGETGSVDASIITRSARRMG